jgi:mRNA-degrading endonuclease toxin of MazEF toxin-antitoxin module
LVFVLLGVAAGSGLPRPTLPARLPGIVRWRVAAGKATQVLVEQTAAVDPMRLGDHAGRLTFTELRQVEAALRLALDV